MADDVREGIGKMSSREISGTYAAEHGPQRLMPRTKAKVFFPVSGYYPSIVRLAAEGIG